MNAKLTTILVTSALASGTLAAQPVTWNLDTSHTVVGFSVRHMMISNVRGTFGSFKGAVQVTGDDPTTARLEVTIDVASIDTREPKRDDHLRSPDFFDAAKLPTMTFTSRKVEKTAAGRLKVTGDLTLRGVTKEIVLDVDTLTPPMKDPWGMMRVGAHATTVISRKDFGLTWNTVLEAGGVAVGDEVSITLDVELVKAVQPAK